jgi:hypothetical protein
METLQKIFFGIGILLIILIPIWLFFVVPELEKIPGDYEGKFVIFEINNQRYDIGGEWSGEFIANAILYTTTVSAAGDRQVIRGHYRSETLSGDLIWEVSPEYTVDRYTRENTEKGGYYLFPQSVKKKSYDVWPFGYTHKFEFDFRGIEEINGLEVYRFGFKDATTDDTEDSSWLDLVPEKYKAIFTQSVDYWIEPVSGIVVNSEGGGIAHYADKVTGEKVQDYITWSNKFSDDTISNQVILAQNEKQRIILIERIIPILLLIIAAALFIAAYSGSILHKE